MGVAREGPLTIPESRWIEGKYWSYWSTIVSPVSRAWSHGSRWIIHSTCDRQAAYLRGLLACIEFIDGITRSVSVETKFGLYFVICLTVPCDRYKMKKEFWTQMKFKLVLFWNFPKLQSIKIHAFWLYFVTGPAVAHYTLCLYLFFHKVKFKMVLFSN